MPDKPEICRGCSFYNIGESYAAPEGPRVYQLGICGEAPGEEEAKEGKPFIGKSGQIIRRGVERAGIEGSVAIYNTINCRPPSNDYSRVGEEVVRYCRLHHWPTAGADGVTLLVGKPALESFYPQLRFPGAQERWRGSVIPRLDGEGWCIPTYHPAFALRGKHHLLATINNDILALANNFDKRQLLPTIVDNISPGKYISVDIETDMESGAITLIGVSSDGEHVAQFGTEDGVEWLNINLSRADYIFAHNARFDIERLERIGLVIDQRGERVIDTMLAFRMYQPDTLTTGLDTACAVTLAGEQLYWKSLIGNDRERLKDKAFTRMVWAKIATMAAYYDEEAWFRFYNALDVMMTWRLGVRLEGLLGHG